MKLSLTWLLAGLLCASSLPLFAAPQEIAGNDAPPPAIAAAAVKKALNGSYAMIRTGVENYPEHRDCFSCHHQALPLLAFSLEGRGELDEAPAALTQSQTTQAILKFTEASFSPKISMMREGSGVGGRALTAAYGLWTMDLGGAPSNETTQAMVEYLLKTQAADGGWEFQSHRPPAASSRAMTTAIAVYGLRAYGFDAGDESRFTQSLRKSAAFAEQHQLDGSHEELIGALWLEQMLSSELSPPSAAACQRLAERTTELWSRQQADGGWAQTPEMTSDAYATGQALLMLTQLGEANRVHADERFQDGIRFLLRTQQAGGSWHVVTRSKPVQVYFDNGDPHGKDQFISMMASNWSTAALANYQATGQRPLESLQVAKRQRAAQNTESTH
jgi:N-acyl-D-amino-acid deacylase